MNPTGPAFTVGDVCVLEAALQQFQATGDKRLTEDGYRALFAKLGALGQAAFEVEKAAAIVKGDVVTIHDGTTQYEVTRVDDLDDQVQVWPRDPQHPVYQRRVDEPEYLGQWVGLSLVHKVPADQVIAYPSDDD